MSTATAEKTILDAVKPQLYIAGEWRNGGEGGTLGVEDPATGEALSRSPTPRSTTPRRR